MILVIVFLIRCISIEYFQDLNSKVLDSTILSIAMYDHFVSFLDINYVSGISANHLCLTLNKGK